jgi:hypothetical protein
MTFVKTKLLLERMEPGDIARVRLKGAEPLENVPRSVRDNGDEVIALGPETAGTGDGTQAAADADDDADAVHLLVIRRAHSA